MSCLRIATCILPLLFARSALAAALCVDPTQPACESTIQAALDAAAPGDVVRVAAGLYLERITLQTPGVRLRGAGDVFIDASDLPPAAGSVIVSAPDVTLQRIAIVNGDGAGIVLAASARARILAVEVVNPAGPCIVSTGAAPDMQIRKTRLRFCGESALESDDSDRLVLEGNRIEGGEGVSVRGDDVRAERNSFVRGLDPLFVSGERAVVTGNRFDRNGGGIAIEGADAFVSRNRLESVTLGIQVVGHDPVVEHNRLAGVEATGIEVRCADACEGGRVEGNRLESLRGTGIEIHLSPGLAVEDNRVLRASSLGIQLDETAGVLVTSNRVTRTGTSSAACSEVRGDGNQLVGNRFTGCAGDGASLAGDGNRVEQNRILDAGDDGVDVAAGTGNQVLDNRVREAGDNGIEISAGASASLVSANRAEGFRACYCDGGMATAGSDVPDASTGCGSVED